MEKPRCHLLTARPAGAAEAYFAIMAFCDFIVEQGNGHGNTGMSNGKMKSACMHDNGAAGAKARAPQRDFNHPRTAAA